MSLFSLPLKLVRSAQAFMASALFIFSSSAFAVDPIYATFFSNIALNGYDVVAYHTDGAAYKGKNDFEYEWKGATWRFYSEENLNLFIDNPEAYEPEYGGYCAYAVAKGTTAAGDPNQFTIIDGKLYFNYNNQTKILWTAERDAFIEQANVNWPNLVDED